jgi:thymidylate kinase
MEREGEDFAGRVEAAYHELAAAFPRRVVRADATRPTEEIADFVREELRDLS